MTTSSLKPSCFYHPTEVIFIDDNRDFLDVLELEFDKLNILTLTDPDATIKILNDHNKEYFPRSVFTVVSDVNVDTTTNHSINFEVKNLLTIIYDESRFTRIPVIIVDYEMPHINGMEFCQKIKERNIYKIMLTAKANQETAINAFNNGLIDKFILKMDENLYSKITSAVSELTQQYFAELSDRIINGHCNHIKSLFNNPLYQQLFSRVKTKAQAIEYYLVDNLGSFLFLDKDANPTWLIIRDNTAMKDSIDLLKGYDLPSHLIHSVDKNEKLLFLLSENEYKKPIGEWVEYLFYANKLDDNYYYSIIDDYLTDFVDWKRVVPFSKYIADKANETAISIHQ